MASQQAQDIVEDLQQQQQSTADEPAEYLGADEGIEVEEVYEDNDEPMDDEDQEDDDNADRHGEGHGDNDDDDDERDDADKLLDGGFDDSYAQATMHEGAVFTMELHPINPLLAVSGGEDDLAYLWRTDTGQQVAKLTGHSDSVTSVGFSKDGEFVATGGMDGRVRVWKHVKSTDNADPMQQDWLSWEFVTNLEGPDEVNWIDWHPKGHVLLAGGADGTVWLWNLPTGNTMHVLSGHMAPVTCGRFTPDGKRIVTCSEDSTLIYWDPRTGEAIHKLTAADARFKLEAGINAVAINPQGTVAVVAGAEGGLRAVNLVQGTVLTQMEGHEEGASIEAVAFSQVPTVGAASLTVLVSVGTDGRVCTWEATGFKLRSTGSHQDAVTSLSFAPGTTTFVTGSADKTLKVWDYRTGSCVKTLLGPRDVIHACSVSKDGQLVISGSEDGMVRVFKPYQDKPDPLAQDDDMA
ncbi:60S ribosomal subunit assembly or modification protein [Microbotryomycetes sp. JL221]|nr:60S ribosomal subunit assembly or modification protein [Microbotryomycetes sp. JL221]